MELNKVSLTICKDFPGRSNQINQTLNFLLGEKLSMDIGNPKHQKLSSNSPVHWYAYMMSKDSHNKLDIYTEISLEDIEKFLKKRK